MPTEMSTTHSTHPTNQSVPRETLLARIRGEGRGADWRDWRWQLRNAITEIETVEAYLGATFAPERRARLRETLARFPLSVTPYYLSLVDREDTEHDPVFRQSFPSPRELEILPQDQADPLAEEHDSPVPGLTHRYPDRVLLHVSNLCAMYCRHCTRKRKVGDVDAAPHRDAILAGIEYIRAHEEVRDVLLSGGDPFLLETERLDWILTELQAIPHVQVVRIGTRTPVVLPQRITNELVEMLRQHHPLWINTHFNHPRELTRPAREALRKLADAGIPLGNQSVLLAGVNDCPTIMQELVQGLVANRVRPYYLYQCDLAEGLNHFRTPVGTGIEIMERLRGHTSGFAVPTYVIDAPGGGGKIPVMPQYLISRSVDKVILRNFEGAITTYTEPARYEGPGCDGDCASCRLTAAPDGEPMESLGVGALLDACNDASSLVPACNDRHARREEGGEPEDGDGGAA